MDIAIAINILSIYITSQCLQPNCWLLLSLMSHGLNHFILMPHGFNTLNNFGFLVFGSLLSLILAATSMDNTVVIVGLVMANTINALFIFVIIFYTSNIDKNQEKYDPKTDYHALSIPIYIHAQYYKIHNYPRIPI